MVYNNTVFYQQAYICLLYTSGSFQTNIEQDEISNLVKDQLSNMSSWTVKSNALTGTGSYGPTYSMGSTKLYIMLPNDSSVAEAKEKINDLLGQ